MTQKITKEKTNTSMVLLDYFKKNNYIFYERNEKDSILFLLPYRLQKIFRVDINIVTISNSNLCRMNFKSKLNPNNDSSKELLDMNSELIDGNLSVATDSNYVSFNINFTLTENDDVDEIYKIHLQQCFSVFYKLQDRNIIEADIIDEKSE